MVGWRRHLGNFSRKSRGGQLVKVITKEFLCSGVYRFGVPLVVLKDDPGPSPPNSIGVVPLISPSWYEQLRNTFTSRS